VIFILSSAFRLDCLAQSHERRQETGSGCAADGVEVVNELVLILSLHPNRREDAKVVSLSAATGEPRNVCARLLRVPQDERGGMLVHPKRW
jgi:hypothetical protein